MASTMYSCAAFTRSLPCSDFMSATEAPNSVMTKPALRPLAP